MNGLNLFAQIRKVDEAKRLVFGRAAQEVVDKVDEILDYASSKPYFQAWSDEISKATDGKSLGNVRAMHGAVAAGKVVGIDFNDAECAIDINTKIVDDKEWQKVLEGVYTGFSIGGKYVGEKIAEKLADGREIKRYTANPVEISLVDNPAISTCTFFEISKSDGSVVKKDFGVKKDVVELAAKKEDEVIEVNVEGDDKDVVELGKVMAEQKLNVKTVIELVKNRVVVVKKFADEQNKRFPIDTVAQVRTSWDYINKDTSAAKYSAEELTVIKDKISTAWKSLIDEQGPTSPEDEAKDMPDKMVKFKKQLEDSNLLVQTIMSLYWTCRSLWAEATYEQDGSTVLNMLSDVLSNLVEVLKALVTEKSAELLSSLDYPMGSTATVSLAVETSLLHKYGARNSKDDGARIQKMHDTCTELGAKCATGDKISATETPEALVKLIADSVKSATAVFAQQLGEAQAKIVKLEAQPATAKIVIRAVSKSADTIIDQSITEGDKIDPVVTHGKKDDVATEIKKLHQTGGKPLFKPT